MLLKLEPESEIPIYMQLRQQVINGIAQGALKPGDMLPSVRQMAVDLGINLHTVNKAYTLLQNEGFVKIYDRKGVMIVEQPGYDDKFTSELEQQLKHIYLEAKGRGMNREHFLKLTSSVIQSAEKGEF